MTPSRLLILGGTTEATALCRSLAGQPGTAPELSLAGRTRTPVLPPVPSRSGGFGGSDGLARYLRDHRIDVLVDATHPFAARISRHAVAAAAAAGIPLLTVRRPPWQARPGDRWTAVADLAAAAAALGPASRRVFLTIGRQELAVFSRHPQHDYLVRSVDAPGADDLPPRATVITARGPFDVPGEIKLLRDGKIEILVTKNAGGDATCAKLAAARQLGVTVIMVDRPPAPDGATVLPAPDGATVPPAPDGATVPDVAHALAWLARHAGAAARGV